MKYLLKSATYLFHPIWMPLVGTLIYFLITPRFFPVPVIQAKLLAILIMTVFIPTVFHFLLRTLDQAESHFLRDVKERRWPLLFTSILHLLILRYVLNVFDYPELYYFFLGTFLSTMFALLLTFRQIKASLHMLGLAGVITFLILLSFHYGLDLIYTISFLIAVLGLTATSRLHFNAHTTNDIILGIFFGVIPQLAVGTNWL